MKNEDKPSLAATKKESCIIPQWKCFCVKIKIKVTFFTLFQSGAGKGRKSDFLDF